jgi:hypothetical protein
MQDKTLYTKKPYFVKSFSNKLFIPLFPKSILAPIAHNVPAVCDGLAARIGKTVGFAGPTNCAGAMAWEWSVA